MIWRRRRTKPCPGCGTPIRRATFACAGCFEILEPIDQDRIRAASRRPRRLLERPGDLVAIYRAIRYIRARRRTTA